MAEHAQVFKGVPIPDHVHCFGYPTSELHQVVEEALERVKTEPRANLQKIRKIPPICRDDMPFPTRTPILTGG